MKYKTILNLFFIFCMPVLPAYARLSREDIDALRLRGQKEGWTFELAQNPASQYDINQLCGLLPITPDEELQRQPQVKEKLYTLSQPALPSSFDWRSAGGCPPVRDQRGCGACWAFAAVGVLECAVKIYDGDTVDLSEQWLVSCTPAGTCAGGLEYKALNCFIPGKSLDSCGHYGSVSENDLPYTASDAPCNCPYGHKYRIVDKYYLRSNDILQIKNAVMTYGPVTATVYVNSAFQVYSKGIFNACDSGHATNHVAVIVGWDDNQGANGVWFVRNSWGTSWGENGYMRIEYGCSSIEESCCYIVYDPNPCPSKINIKQGITNIVKDAGTYDFGSVALGQNKEASFVIENLGSGSLELTGSPAIRITGPDLGDFSVVQQPLSPVLPDRITSFKIYFTPSAPGLRSAVVSIQNNDSANTPYNFSITGTGISIGKVVSWGNNVYGQCQTPSPDIDFIAVSAGAFHSLGLKQDTSIAAWGNDSNGQCDLTASVTAPNSDYESVAAGGYHSLGLKADGSVIAWGDNAYGQCDVPADSSFKAISAGGYHSLGLKLNGSIVAWGDNTFGQCVVPDSQNSPNINFVAVSAGSSHSLALKSDGSIMAWGDNSYGQCDVPIAGTEPNSAFKAVAAGREFSLALKSDGSMLAWGNNSDGQCDVPADSGFKAVAAGSHHALGLKADGSIVAWGADNFRQCDVPSSGVSPDSGFTSITAGAYHSAALAAKILAPASGLIVTRCAVTAGKAQNDNKDSITISGIIDITPADFADLISVKFGDVYQQEIPVTSFAVKKSIFTYNYKIPKNGGGAITSFVINTSKHTFVLKTKKIDLTCLHNPFQVEFATGNFRDICSVDEKIINGRGFIPVQLMNECEDYLQIKSAKVKKGKSSDTFTIKGGIALKDPAAPLDTLNLCQTGLTLTLDNQTFTIPPENFKYRGKTGLIYYCPSNPISPSGYAWASFNFSKSTFSITIKNTRIDSTSGNIDFILDFGDFYQETTVDIIQ